MSFSFSSILRNVCSTGRAIYSPLFLMLYCTTVYSQSTETLTVQNTDFNILWNQEIKPSERPVIREWIRNAGETLALLNGTMPKSAIRIELETRRGGTAVPYAQVLRKHPEGIAFLINPGRPLIEFIQDWTAVHELTHLYIPYPGSQDVWLSEGLATYYQYLLQSRAGTITEQQAWEKMVAGLKRGKNESQFSFLTLQQLSDDMREYGAYMRVYWSGTLLFLEADIALRKNSQGKQSLDTVLKRFQQCCRPNKIYWRGSALIRALDRASETTIFSTLYKQYKASRAIPDYNPALRKLGITVSNNRVTLSTGNNSATIMRRAISAKR